jgi:hypothetical protein
MKQNHFEVFNKTKRLFGGREIILAPIGEKQRIGWVYKDTGLPPTEEETEAVPEKQKKLKEQEK